VATYFSGGGNTLDFGLIPSGITVTATARSLSGASVDVSFIVPPVHMNASLMR